MRQYYQKTAEDIYKKFCEKNDKEDEDFAYKLSNVLIHSKTYQTLGSEGEADISYSLAYCLRSVDPIVAQEVEHQLDKHYAMISCSSNIEQAREAVCQRVFHYGLEHLKNTIYMIDIYMEALDNPQESILDENIIKVLPELKKIENATKNELIDILNNIKEAGIKPLEFCDEVENTLRQSFVNGLNNELNSTVDMLKKSPSRLKKLEGGKFDLLIHSALNPESLMEERVDRGFSVSLIDDHNIKCYIPDNIKFVFYDGLKPEETIYAKSRDGSTDVNDNGELSAFSVPDWMPVESFKKQTIKAESSMKYSEIFVANGNQLRPDAIVCFDEVSKHELEFANKYNLDIILIDTSKYPDMVRQPSSRERGVGSNQKADLSQFEYQDDEEYEME